MGCVHLNAHLVRAHQRASGCLPDGMQGALELDEERAQNISWTYCSLRQEGATFDPASAAGSHLSDHAVAWRDIRLVNEVTANDGQPPPLGCSDRINNAILVTQAVARLVVKKTAVWNWGWLAQVRKLWMITEAWVGAVGVPCCSYVAATR
jgi:hypothetical protein